MFIVVIIAFIIFFVLAIAPDSLSHEVLWQKVTNLEEEPAKKKWSLK